MLLSDFNDPPIPNDRKEAPANAQRFNGVIAQAQDIHSIEIPSGNYYTYSFGPGTDGGSALRRTSIYGEGPTSQIIHDSADTGNQSLWVPNGVSDMFDCQIRNMRFVSEHQDRACLELRGYTVSLENLYLSGPQGGDENNVGLILNQGNQWMLRNVQAEFFGVGMLIKEPYYVTLDDINVEYSQLVGLKVLGPDTPGRNVGLQIDGLFSEANPISLHAIGGSYGVRVSLKRLIGDGKVILEKNRGSLIDLSNSTDHDVEFLNCHSCQFKTKERAYNVSFNDDTNLNPWQVGHSTRTGIASSSPDITLIGAEQTLRKDFTLGSLTDKDVTFELDWEQDKYSELTIQVQDVESGDFYDFENRSWTGVNTYYPMYGSGQVNRIRVPIFADGVSRNVSVSCFWFRAESVTVGIHEAKLSV